MYTIMRFKDGKKIHGSEFISMCRSLKFPKIKSPHWQLIIGSSVKVAPIESKSKKKIIGIAVEHQSITDAIDQFFPDKTDVEEKIHVEKNVDNHPTLF